ncbi:hypothetical protein Clacol_010312 [Clathrus columnatus]|uniref:Uncharacterized protein n=1 Tax=Clathrus columnatus TaxID=1419009 RepID=A0AAV5ATR9_9AGAM|nr:hypothetical protein Clacol_010312 [Clathrus columnatus]
MDELAIPFNGIFTKTPTRSLEKLIISHGHDITDFIQRLGDTSLCHQVKHISYTDIYSDISPEDVARLGTSIGKLLLECLQVRQKAYGNVLNSIFLPPLPERFAREAEETLMMRSRTTPSFSDATGSDASFSDDDED